MTNRRTSVAMTREVHDRLSSHLLRADGQEEICLATYRPSNGVTRTSALLREVLLPRRGERQVHGNASIIGDYVIRAASIAQERDEGIVICHSHPDARGWQSLSGPDWDAESSFANLAREMTGQPLVGMTLSGSDSSWSARHWDLGIANDVRMTECTNVRVIGDQLTLSWNDGLVPPPSKEPSQRRSVTCWGPAIHADLVRRSVLIVGAGSIGLDVALRLAATGVTRIGIMDFDSVEEGNLDRLIGARPTDVWLQNSKVEVAEKLLQQSATAAAIEIQTWEHSICEPAGLAHALDFDLVICCVDRPWPRAVLNGIAYTDLIPVIDGGIAIDAFNDGHGMRNATWRSHVIRPGRPCMGCNGQLQLGQVMADIKGHLDDPEYVAGHPDTAVDHGQNVAALSISAAAGLLAQYVSFNVAPGGIGDPGPLQYVLSTHTLDQLDARTSPHCPYEKAECDGDSRHPLTGEHALAENKREERRTRHSSVGVIIGRHLDRMHYRALNAASRMSSRRPVHRNPRLVAKIRA